MHRKHSLRLLEVNPRHASHSGFTLIELIVTIAIVAILMTLAAPSFVTMHRNSALTATANTLVAAINGARSEAMKRGMYAMLVPKDNANWASGWVAFVDTDRSQSYNAANDITIMSGDELPPYLIANGTDGSTVGSSPYVLYDASGYSRLKTGGFTASTLEIGFSDGSLQRRIKIAPTGRTLICTPQSYQDSNCDRTG